MGGLGSTRWRGHDRKTLVNECRSLSVATLVGSLPPAAGRTGYLVWAGEWNASGLAIGYRFLDDRRVVFVGGGRPVVWALDLVTAGTPNGGVRYLALCPLRVGNQACGRPVAKLYRPPDEAVFGCRSCHRLTYRSRQAHDRRVTALLNAETDWLSTPPVELTATQLGLLLATASEHRRRADRVRRQLAPRPRPRRRR